MQVRVKVRARARARERVRVRVSKGWAQGGNRVGLEALQR